MTTATSIITDAYRENNLIGVTASPTSAELTEALRLLNTLITGSLGVEIGDELSDWLVPVPQRTAQLATQYTQAPSDQFCDSAELLGISQAGANTPVTAPYPPPNSRIVFGSVANTVYFPEAPNDGARMAIVQGSGAGDGGATGQTLTLDGNGRTIEGANTQAYNAPVAARQWLYRADLGDWVAVVTLGTDDEVPFPSDVDDFWITALNIRLSRRQGRAVAQETLAAFKRVRSIVQARYRQEINTTYGAGQIPNTYQSYRPGGRWNW